MSMSFVVSSVAFTQLIGGFVNEPAQQQDSADLMAFAQYLDVWRDELTALYESVPLHHKLRAAASLVLDRAMDEHAPRANASKKCVKSVSCGESV